MAGCARTSNLPCTDFSVIDALGRDLLFSGLPEKIVIAGKQTPMLANFVYLFENSPEKIVAIENRSQSKDRLLSIIDDAFEEKLVLEKGAGVEQIAPLDPDLVILKTVMKEQVGDQLEEIGIDVLYVSFESLDDIYRDVQVIGKVFGEERAAKDVVKFYEKTKSKIDEMVMEETAISDILIVQVSLFEGNTVFKVPSSSWLQTQMVYDLNGNPVWASDAISGGWTEVNVEQIFQWNPKLIVVVSYQGEAQEIIMSLQEDPVWAAYISENEVGIKPFPYDFISWDQPDPRWILGYASIAHYLYPEIMGVDEVLDITKDFYSEFYNLESDFISNQVSKTIAEQIQ